MRKASFAAILEEKYLLLSLYAAWKTAAGENNSLPPEIKQAIAEYEELTASNNKAGATTRIRLMEKISELIEKHVIPNKPETLTAK